MAGRNGAGIFTVTNPDFVSGTTISSSEMDANFSDVATGITQSIAADGQTTITANLPMNSKKLTGLAAGSTAGDSVRYEQLDTTTGVKGADLASAEPLVIGTDGNYFDVTGTVGIATHTVAANRHYFTQFDGACILTHNATTQDLPGEANITTAAGDVAEWQSTGANTVQCVNYTKADGTAVVGAVAASETVSGIVELATTIEAAAGTDTTRAVTAAGVAAAIAAQVTPGATEAERANIMLNAFRISVNGGLSIQAMVDGIVDEYTDQTGINTGSSTDETYNATGDYYENPGVLAVTPDTGDYTGNTGNYTIGSGSASCLSGSHNIYVTTALSGDFSISINLAAGGTSSKFGVFLASEVGTFNATANAGGMDSMTSSWWFDTGAGQYKYGTSSVQGLAQTTGTYILARVGSVITLTAPASSKVFTQESSADVIICLCSQGSSTYNTMSWTSAGSATNMVLISDTFTALSAPTTGLITIWHQAVDSVTLNIDLVAAVSRDAGSTWTNITLASVATLATGQVLTGSADISAQPSGTSMIYRLTVANNKYQYIRATALQWS
jgi:hypothetical protein